MNHFCGPSSNHSCARVVRPSNLPNLIFSQNKNLQLVSEDKQSGPQNQSSSSSSWSIRKELYRRRQRKNTSRTREKLVWKKRLTRVRSKVHFSFFLAESPCHMKPHEKNKKIFDCHHRTLFADRTENQTNSNNRLMSINLKEEIKFCSPEGGTWRKAENVRLSVLVSPVGRQGLRTRKALCNQTETHRDFKAKNLPSHSVTLPRAREIIKTTVGGK